MVNETKYKRKKWFRALPLRNGVVFNSMLGDGLEFKLDVSDVLSVRGEKGNQYLSYLETGIMLKGYVNKNDVRRLSDEESEKIDLVMVAPFVSYK